MQIKMNATNFPETAAVLAKLSAKHTPNVLTAVVMPKKSAASLKDGYYTVQFHDEPGHITFRVETQSPTASFMPGKTIISRLVGPDNTTSYRGVAFASAWGYNLWSKVKAQGDERLVRALDILAGDPKGAAEGYARASKRCYVCNRPLTTPESLESGIGPVCAGKGY